MPRFRLDVEYDGGPYAGWQRQKGQPSVQAALERAFEALAGEAVVVRGAGRTDAGVHATGQVAHADLSADRPEETVRDALNAHLRQAGDSVTVISARQVDSTFDARFSATRRHYLYRILNRRAPPALERGRAWWVQKPLDDGAMAVAAARLVGRHDFTTFRSVHCQAASPVRTLDRLDVVRTGDVVEVRASARSFLHNQVRSMVGTLRRVGDRAWTADDVTAALERRQRAACGPVAPPEGLYLVSVDYGPADSPSSD